MMRFLILALALPFVAGLAADGIEKRRGQGVLLIPLALLTLDHLELQSQATLSLVATPCRSGGLRAPLELEFTAPLIGQRGIEVDLSLLPDVDALWRCGIRDPNTNAIVTSRLIPIVPLVQTESDGSAAVRVFVPAAEMLQAFGLELGPSGVVRRVADDLDVIDGPRPEPGDIIGLTPFRGMATARCRVDLDHDTPLIPMETARTYRDRAQTTLDLERSGETQPVTLRVSPSWVQLFDKAATVAASVSHKAP